ncbi:hypothetical protein Pint_35134 [Pistacia integerrima]|uniref:Uncharacterized protein n=1 Tax=Pistacia integerrima TaxID=434235 RepID=A0ACC0Y150_9ROSI|nr:hypothetical protein Pint_35134 [Pistacia integerrima]
MQTLEWKQIIRIFTGRARQAFKLEQTPSRREQYLGHYTSMRHFHLNNNSIVGQLPPELFNLSRLIHLLVDNNNLIGSLPPEYSELPTLRILQLDNNNFSGTEIPATYGNFSSLVKLKKTVLGISLGRKDRYTHLVEVAISLAI